MRARSYFLSTLKEAPADADVISQQYMIRAGMIKKLAAGVYTYMPVGLRTIRKIEKIIREEMDRAGAIELLMPLVQPAELWQESGRWEKYGAELLRFKDRHDRDFVIQPTSEEVVTDIARQEIKSWRQLPVNFYHIQTKFRDERRPRFGVMRGREFTMKDAYSFDRDAEGAAVSYDKMYQAYQRIFTRLGLMFRAVRADTGAIGGSRSHEFQVIANAGEDVIAYCPDSDYAANIELAEARSLIDVRAAAAEEMVKRPTPGKEKCHDVAEFLGIPFEKSVKSVVLAADRTDEKGNPLPAKIVLILLRADHDLNEVKAGHLPELKDGFRFATDAEILENFGSKPGYLGPVGIKEDVAVYADLTVANMSDFCCGANEEGYHYTGVNFGRDLPEPKVADLRNVVEGDASPDGKGMLRLQRGIDLLFPIKSTIRHSIWRRTFHLCLIPDTKDSCTSIHISKSRVFIIDPGIHKPDQHTLSLQIQCCRILQPYHPTDFQRSHIHRCQAVRYRQIRIILQIQLRCPFPSVKANIISIIHLLDTLRGSHRITADIIQDQIIILI